MKEWCDCHPPLIPQINLEVDRYLRHRVKNVKLGTYYVRYTEKAIAKK